MPHFTFQAKNSQGQTQSGIIEADSDIQARSDLAKVGLQIISLTQSQTPPPSQNGKFFAFKYQAKKGDQPVQGTIDASDEQTAKVRLQNEFNFQDIHIQAKVQIHKRPNFTPSPDSSLVKKFHQPEPKPETPIHPIDPISPVPKPSLQTQIPTPEPGSNLTFWQSTKSFISWLLFIYFTFYLLSTLLLKVDLGFFTDLLHDTKQSPIFIWLLIGLFIFFTLTELPHLIRTWQKPNTMISSIFISSFILLLPLGFSQSWLITLRFHDTIPEQVIFWSQTLNWPLTLIILLFILSFRALPSRLPKPIQ